MLKIYALNINFLKDEEMYKKALSILPVHRLRALERITHDQTRLLSVGSGLLLKYGFLKYGLDVNKFRFAKTDNGKPYVAESDAPHFNISHSGDYAVCAFSDYDVGVDVQRVVPVSKKLLDYVCTEAESAWIQSFSPSARDDAFFRLWTAKESLIKLLGGSVLKLRDLALSFDGGALSAPGRSAHFFEYSLDGYKLTACSAQEDFCDGVKIIQPEDVFDV